MKAKAQSLFASVVFAVLAGAVIAVAQDCGSQNGIVVHPGQGVEFSQVTYMFPEVLANVGAEPSSTGAMAINVAQLQTVMNGGFVNVVTPDGWVTQNVPVFSNPNEPYILTATLNLDVAVGTEVSSLNATVCYSAQPLAQISSIDFDNFPVGAMQYAAEGIGEQQISSIPPPPQIGELSFLQQGLNRWFIQRQHSWQNTDVQAASNQCAPAAAANSLAWLKIARGVPIPDANIPGLRDRVRNSLVGALDMDMQTADPLAPRVCAGLQPGRWAVDRATGLPTPAISQLKGTMQYLSDHNIMNLNLKHQGAFNAPCDGFSGAQDVQFHGLTSKGQGAQVDPNFIYNEIANNSAVEYDAVNYNRLGQPAGGHAMAVIGAGTTNGHNWILFISDHLQTVCGGYRNQFFPYACQGPFYFDNMGTTYTWFNGGTYMIVDFSYLNSTNGQPRLSGGYMPGAYAVAVITQSKP